MTGLTLLRMPLAVGEKMPYFASQRWRPVKTKKNRYAQHAKRS
jgi:hypothetical protein